MAIIGTIITRLTANSTTFNRKMKKSAGMVGAFRKQAKMLRNTLIAGVGIFAMVRGIKKTIAAFAVQQAAEAKLEAVITATGTAAGRTANELKKMASQLQAVTTFGDETTISAMAVLATFKQVKGGVFDQAIRASQDMATVMGTDLKSAAVLVGKALNDPKIGLTALQRVGVTFNDTQKAMIKDFVLQNDLIAAQVVMLKELESQFGGAAEAVAESETGRLSQFGNMLGDAGEEIGEGFVHLFDMAIGGAISKGMKGQAEFAKRQLARGSRKTKLDEFKFAAKALSKLEKTGTQDVIAMAKALRRVFNAGDAMSRGAHQLYQRDIYDQTQLAAQRLKHFGPLATAEAKRMDEVKTATALAGKEIAKLKKDIDRVMLTPNDVIKKSIASAPRIVRSVVSALQTARDEATRKKSLEGGAARIIAATMTATEKYTAKVADLNEMKKDGLLTSEQYARALKKEGDTLRANGTGLARLKGIWASVTGFADKVGQGKKIQDDRRRAAAAALQFAGLPQAVEGSSMFRGIAAAFKRDEEKRLSVERNELLKDINSKQPKSFIGRVIDWAS